MWIIATPVYWKLVLRMARPGKVSLAQRKRSSAGICSKTRAPVSFGLRLGPQPSALTQFSLAIVQTPRVAFSGLNRPLGVLLILFTGQQRRRRSSVRLVRTATGLSALVSRAVDRGAGQCASCWLIRSLRETNRGHQPARLLPSAVRIASQTRRVRSAWLQKAILRKTWRVHNPYRYERLTQFSNLPLPNGHRCLCFARTPSGRLDKRLGLSRPFAPAGLYKPRR